MRKITLTSTAILGAMLALLLHAAPAQAQNRTWVASNGGGAVCSRAAPCATFAAAHTATTAGGEINCVDAGDYGPVTITKSINIVCDNTQAGILAAGTFGIRVNAGVNDIVTLKGLDIEGAGTGTDGIRFDAGAALHVHKVQIRNFRASAGISVINSGYSELYVADSYITDNAASAGEAGGITISPGGTGSANVTLNRVQIENSNNMGLFVSNGATTGVAVNVVVQDSVIAGSTSHGIRAFSDPAKATISIVVDGTVVAGNFASGINAQGSKTTIRVGDSTIVNNVTGVSTSGGGVVQSYKDNMIAGNLTDGTPITAFPGPGGQPLQ